jgi:hypothetical protein
MSNRAIVMKAVEDDGTRTNEQRVEEFASAAAIIRKAIDGMTTEQLLAHPLEGKWSTLEVVCHLADCDQFIADRIKRTIATDNPLLLGASAGQYPIPLFYERRDIDEEIRLIDLTRAQLARILSWLEPDAWQRTAVHSDIGSVTLRQLIIHACFHVRHHLKFVEEKRAALGMAGPLTSARG